MTDRQEQRRDPVSQEAEPRRRSFATLLLLAVCALLAFAGFIALGTWQLQRLQWKLALIERVDQRVHAAPVAAPGPERWPQVSAEADEYRHVRVTGTFLYELTTRVQATTALGSGYWLLTPLRSADGYVVLVNRGFIPVQAADRGRYDSHNGTRDAGQHQSRAGHGVSTVNGLLRISEPGGAFLRHNDPAANRWYSRDVQAIAAARGLPNAAPYFVDADAAKESVDEKSGEGSADAPIGGLTVISFHNNHMVYALTWYALALMVAGAGLWVAREERRLRRGAAPMPIVSIEKVKMAGKIETVADREGMKESWAAAASVESAAGHKNMLQLIQLRWIAVVGQITTIAVVTLGLGIRLPLPQMLAVLVCLIAFNIGSQLRWHERRFVTNRELFFALLVDVASLTAQLYFSGGTTNPFAFLFLLQVIISAVLLEAWSTWTIVAITSACLAGLALFSEPLTLPLDRWHSFPVLYVQGMLICFVLNAALLVVFITRINRNARARDAQLADLRQRAAEEEHIVRMGLLASGAAHELGTPLATLSVILGDWRRMPEFSKNAELREEIAEMQAQLQRCKTIVSGILLSAGETRGESSVKTTISTFLNDLVKEWRSSRPIVSFVYENRIQQDLPVVFDSALKQTIFNVLDNAFEASPHWLSLEAKREGDSLKLSITDAGPGFAPAMLAQFGKPYQSSKGRPGGGLGLFLAVNVSRTLGGTVTARNRAEGGAVVELTLPLTAITLDKDKGHAIRSPAADR